MGTRDPDSVPHNTNGGPSPNFQASFASPEFHSKVVEILSRAANGCMQELNYAEMHQQIADLEMRAKKYQADNTRLFKDNQRLSALAVQWREKASTAGKAYVGEIDLLEKQVAALRGEVNEGLIREQKLSAGVPDYARLHSDFMRTRHFCMELQQQVAMLKHMLAEYQSNALSSRPTEARGPSHPVELRMPTPLQQTMLLRHPSSTKPSDPMQNFMHANQIILTQQSQLQATFSHHPTPNIPPAQRAHSDQPAMSKQGPSAPTQMDANGVTSPHRTFVPIAPRPLSSSSSNHSNDTMEVEQRALRPSSGTQAAIRGWHDVGANRTVIVNQPQLPIGRRVSGPIPGQAPVQVQFTSGAGPVFDERSGSHRPPIFAMPVYTLQPPLARTPPSGMSVVSIGPPGQLLPPLTASIMRHPSAVVYPTANGSLAQRDYQSSPPIVDQENKPADNRQATAQDQIIGAEMGEITPQTFNVTPPSSCDPSTRSEVLEMSTPQEAFENDMVGVVSAPSMSASAASLKRGSVEALEEEQQEAETRKKLKMDTAERKEEAAQPINQPVDQLVDQQSDGVKNTANTDLASALEETEDEEDEDEIGPDGLRSIKACLETFVDEDESGIPTCQLCVVRHASGLIGQLATFANATQEKMVEHFLSEHPSSWEDLLHCRNG